MDECKYSKKCEYQNPNSDTCKDNGTARGYCGRYRDFQEKEIMKEGRGLIAKIFGIEQ